MAAFFDHYVPDPVFHCPVCGAALEGWTGVDGPCVFLTIRQGVPGGVLPDWSNEPAVDGGTILDPEIANAPHPEAFVIESDSCSCEYSTRVRCHSKDGVWTRSDMLTGTPEDREWKGPETRAGYKRRMKWLDRAR